MASSDPLAALFEKKPKGRPPWILAPMAGITDAPFRRLAARYGADYTVSEMIASQAMVRQSAKTLHLASGLDDGQPVSVQIAGADPMVMAEAARLNVDRGAAVIDINMGCPVKKIAKSLAGAALMRDESRAGRILEAVVRAVPVPVTLKIRLGWDDANRNGARMAQIAEQAGVRAVAVHGRTRMQMFTGMADWQAIGAIKQAVSIPVIGNGDVHTPEDAQRLWENTAVDGIMIGRAALGRPWIFRQIAHFLETGQQLPPPPLSERRWLILNHFHAMIDFYGPVVGNRVVRKHLAWHTRGMTGGAAFRDQVNRSNGPDQTLQRITRFLDDQKPQLAA